MGWGKIAYVGIAKSARKPRGESLVGGMSKAIAQGNQEVAAERVVNGDTSRKTVATMLEGRATRTRSPERRAHYTRLAAQVRYGSDDYVVEISDAGTVRVRIVGDSQEMVDARVAAERHAETHRLECIAKRRERRAAFTQRIFGV